MKITFNNPANRKFLTREDCPQPTLVTIARVTYENVAKENAPERQKYCVYFQENVKPMVLNETNFKIISTIINSEDGDAWRGHKIVLYFDPTVAFEGKPIGGIRVRAPQNEQSVPKVRAEITEPEPGPEEDVPF
jgi:hypothetical protein